VISIEYANCELQNAISGKRLYIIIVIIIIIIISTVHMECKNKVDTSNNRGDWDYFKVIQKIREEQTGKT